MIKIIIIPKEINAYKTNFSMLLLLLLVFPEGKVSESPLVTVEFGSTDSGRRKLFGLPELHFETVNVINIEALLEQSVCNS
jgi:hypothetical protein